MTANRRADAVAALEAALGYAFKDKSLLERALTHASVGDGMAKVAHNERLEFLGDRVLGLIAADALMTTQPDWQEGQLTRRHATLVNGQACARVARKLDIGPALRLAGGAANTGGRQNDTILGDAMEAVMAAVYLDGGLGAACALFTAAWAEELARTDNASEREPKTNLQEWAMARGLPIITTTGGAAAQTVPDAAALKVPPGDVLALREALQTAIADAALRARLSDASWLAGQGLPRWSDGAALIARVLHSIAGARP